MVRVILAQRRSAILTPSSLACLSHIPTINLTAGCSIGCAYCYTVGYSAYPGEDTVVLYENTLEKLRAELDQNRKQRPTAVFFSPSSDLFQPVPEVLDLTHRVLEFLFSEGIGVTFLTKGRIPDTTLKLLLQHADKVRAEIGMITIDEEIARIFEPEAADPKVRLQQIASLIAGGIPTEARIDPILPGITDTASSLRSLCSCLARAGVKRTAASTLFLRPAILESLRRNVPHGKVMEDLLSFYRDASRLAIRAESSSVIALPATTRQAILERVTNVAEEWGIRVAICACKNPDLSHGACGINGRWPTHAKAPVQRRLFPRE